MSLIAENHSMYPRVGESDEELRLRRAHHRFDHGEIDKAELKSIVDSYVEDVIKEQLDAGLDVVTDGMIRWYDHISHLAEGIAGAEVAGLVRYFDTNYLVREANVTGHLEWESPLTVDSAEFAQSVTDVPTKAILTGPYTMAQYSIIEDGPYSSRKDLAEDYASVLSQEIKALEEAGINHLQLEDPSILQAEEDTEWALELMDECLESVRNITTRLATYFGDAAPLYDQLQNSQADILVFDFTYSDDLEDIIKSDGSDKR
ncbi:MAG: hypothetical protein ABEJ65_04260, partial [bacterium]